MDLEPTVILLKDFIVPKLQEVNSEVEFRNRLLLIMEIGEIRAKVKESIPKFIVFTRLNGFSDNRGRCNTVIKQNYVIRAVH